MSEQIKGQWILYLSPVAAKRAGDKAVAERRADTFRVIPRFQRNDDKSYDQGFAAQLLRGGKHVGFA